MARNFVLTISRDYPERYWLKTHVLSGGDHGVFSMGVPIEKKVKVSFEASSKVSTSRLLSYDFYFSDGPSLISPRFYTIMGEENISGVQFLEASLMLGDTSLPGYKIFNVIGSSRVLDLEKSVSEPLISTMPDGPKWFSEIALDENLALSHDVVRAEEDFTVIVVKERVKAIFEKHSVRGLRFEP
ncbi:imm11 family protein [Pseudomonas monteilii]